MTMFISIALTKSKLYAMKHYISKSKQVFSFLVKKIHTYINRPDNNRIQQKTYLRNSFYNPFADQSYILSRSKKSKTPFLIFDAGANHGKITKKYKNIFSNSIIHCFEPEPNNFLQLKQEAENLSDCFLHQSALGDANGTITFHLTSSSTMHSPLELTDANKSPFYAESVYAQTQINVDQITIDEFCSNDQNIIDQIHILKMDVQGYELNVLKGASKMLSCGKIDIIYSEVLFNPLYKKQCNFSQIFDFLAGFDYVLFGIYDIRQGSNGQIGWADAIFIKQSIASELPDDAYPLHQITGYRYDEFQLPKS